MSRRCLKYEELKILDKVCLTEKYEYITLKHIIREIILNQYHKKEINIGVTQ